MKYFLKNGVTIDKLWEVVTLIISENEYIVKCIIAGDQKKIGVLSGKVLKILGNVTEFKVIDRLVRTKLLL
jgi:Asp-tRNA(Asn)/Glu-tRNA(Gln) amidotransferase B subunit